MKPIGFLKRYKSKPIPQNVEIVIDLKFMKP